MALFSQQLFRRLDRSRPFWVDDMDGRRKAENEEKHRTFRP